MEASLSYVPLRELRGHLQARDFPRDVVRRMTGIGDVHSANPRRMHELLRAEYEPWFSEALKLWQLFGNMPGILTMTGLSLTDAARHAGPISDQDWPSWLSGVDQSLALAVRITKRLGLRDPIELTTFGGAWKEVEHVLATNERNAAHGECPWCLTAYPEHTTTCLAAAIRRPGVPAGCVNAIYTPGNRGRGPRAQRAGMLGYLRTAASAIRAASSGRSVTGRGTKVTQTMIAELLGYDMFHYSRIERGVLPLPLPKGELLAQYYGVELDDIYRTPSQANPGPTLTREPSMRYVSLAVRSAADHSK